MKVIDTLILSVNSRSHNIIMICDNQPHCRVSVYVHLFNVLWKCFASMTFQGSIVGILDSIVPQQGRRQVVAWGC